MTFTCISEQNIIEILDAGHKDVDQCISIRFFFPPPMYLCQEQAPHETEIDLPQQLEWLARQ